MTKEMLMKKGDECFSVTAHTSESSTQPHEFLHCYCNFFDYQQPMSTKNPYFENTVDYGTQELFVKRDYSKRRMRISEFKISISGRATVCIHLVMEEGA